MVSTKVHTIELRNNLVRKYKIIFVFLLLPPRAKLAEQTQDTRTDLRGADEPVRVKSVCWPTPAKSKCRPV